MELIFKKDQIQNVAKKIIKEAEKNNTKVIAFFGKMGVGKTTLIKNICKELNVIDVVQSPTFAIINQYMTLEQQPVFHFDFYRIEKLEDAINIGFDEYFNSGYYCLIEWPEIIENFLPENTLKIFLTELDDKTRKLKI